MFRQAQKITLRLPPLSFTKAIGHTATLMNMPRLHLKFLDWAKQYDDVFSVKVLNKTIINSPTLVKEVYEKHFHSSSNRPHSIIQEMLIPDSMNPATTRYGAIALILPHSFTRAFTANEGWKAFRRAAVLNHDNMKRLAPYQEAEQLFSWLPAIGRFTTSFAMGIVYGTRGATLESKYVAAFRHVHPQFMSIFDFGKAP
ncbi:hypothetical protein F5887DRAFT_1090780 [Amanita rubescens]|nr:hypothetical protein F5887DRAFT_1090780 [Amanita rubescens]